MKRQRMLLTMLSFNLWHMNLLHRKVKKVITRLKNTPKTILFVFILSMSLRLVLAFLNRDANDNHIEVINWIVDKHEIPEKNDCGQCYHLMLFYVLSAGIIKSFHLTSEDSRIV
jgi:hypothetical protein